LSFDSSLAREQPDNVRRCLARQFEPIVSVDQVDRARPIQLQTSRSSDSCDLPDFKCAAIFEPSLNITANSHRHYSFTNRPLVDALATPVRRPNHLTVTPVSARRMKCWTSAKKHSFYARDNVANFLTWCRTLGVRDVLLFESEDLVLVRRPKNVLLCLLEVARIACRHLQLDLSPTLIQLEQEIELQEQQEQMQQLEQLQQRQQLNGGLIARVEPIVIDYIDLSEQTQKLTIANDANVQSDLSEQEGRSSTSCSVSTDGSDLLSAASSIEPKPLLEKRPKSDLMQNESNDKESDGNSIDSNEENWKYWKPNGTDRSEGKCQPLQPIQVAPVSAQTARIRLANVISHVRPNLQHLESGFTSKLLELRQTASSESHRSKCKEEAPRSLDEDSRSSSNSSIETQNERKTSTNSQMTISQLDQKVRLHINIFFNKLVNLNRITIVAQVMLIAKSYYGKKVRNGIQRLAEGKYRIAGKIVFVRVSKTSF
jgi:hypothetical protein